MSDAGYCALSEPLLSSWHVIRPCSQQMGHLWIGKGNSSWCVYQDPATVTAPAPCHGTSSGQESQAWALVIHLLLGHEINRLEGGKGNHEHHGDGGRHYQEPEKFH